MTTMMIMSATAADVMVHTYIYRTVECRIMSATCLTRGSYPLTRAIKVAEQTHRCHFASNCLDDAELEERRTRPIPT